MVDSKRKLSSLSSGLKVVSGLINTATESPDLLLSRAAGIAALTKAIRHLDKSLSETRNPIRKKIRVLHNTMVSLKDGLVGNTIDPDEYIAEIADCADIVDTIEVLAASMDVPKSNDTDEAYTDGSLLSESNKTEREVELSDISKRQVNVDTSYQPNPKKQVSDASYHSALKALNKYEKYRSHLKTSIRPTAIIPVELPLAVTFENNSLRNPANLNAAFLEDQVSPIGVNGMRSSDIALILRDQVVLQFSKTYAIEQAEEAVNSGHTAKTVKNSKEVIKTLKANIKALEKTVASTVGYIDDLDKEAESQRTKIAAARFRRAVAPQREELSASLAKQQDRLASLKAKLLTAEERARVAKSTHYQHKKTATTRAEMYHSYINGFLDQMAERGQKYTLLSYDFVQSPVNKDIMLCWIVPATVYQKLANLSGGNTKVHSWGLAWSSSGAIRTKQRPASMDNYVSTTQRR